LDEGLAKAKKQGFGSYTGFPDEEKEYNDKVIEKFGQRLIKTERNDLKEFYDFWKINPKYKNDDYYMLAFTQGILPTDNYEFLADFNPKKGLSFISEIAGLSKTNIDKNLLSVGDLLRYKIEPKHEQDDKAVSLYKGETFLGYVKIIHNRLFHKKGSGIEVVVHHLESNGKLDRAFIEVRV
jgi:hypothetical protein